MANVIHSNDFVKPIAYYGYYVSLADEQSAWPASNVGVVNRPYQLWRSLYSAIGPGTPSTSTRLVMDLGAAGRNVNYIAIDNTNWTSVAVCSATDLGITANIQAHAVGQAISTDSVDGRRKAFLSLTNVNLMKRYLALYVPSTPNPSFTGYIGTVALLQSATTMTSNPGFPLVYTSEQAVMANAGLAGGGRAPIRLGQRYATLSFSQSGHPWSSRTDLFTLAGYSSAEPIVLYLNNGDTSQVYICYRTSPLSISQPGANVLALPNGITFEECV